MDTNGDGLIPTWKCFHRLNQTRCCRTCSIGDFLPLIIIFIALTKRGNVDLGLVSLNWVLLAHLETDLAIFGRLLLYSIIL